MILTLASSLSILYGLGARLRRALYARGLLQVKRLPAPVVSVGNLTVGGTGKTPMAACLARLFTGQGYKIAILSRGYGGTAKGVTRISDGQQIYARPPDAGEEAYWLARALPGVSVYTSHDRHAAGLAAWREAQPDLFLLDDGFQHFQLHRDLDVVLLDAEAPFGNGYLLPRGPLREPLATLAVAQVLILTRFQSERHQDRLKSLQEKFPGKTVLTATILPTRVLVLPEGREMPLESLQSIKLLAFAGLARPRVFSDTLRDLGVDLLACRDFPDHYVFQPQDLNALVKEGQTLGAAGLITTTKDWARLGEKWEHDFPLWVLEVEACLEKEGENRILEVLGKVAGGLPRLESPGYQSQSSPTSPATPLSGVGGEGLGEGVRVSQRLAAGATAPPALPYSLPLPIEVRQRFQELQVRGNFAVAPAAVRRILVRAPNWVGDAVMALPVLAGVRTLFPQAEITVWAAPRVAPLFAGIPGVAQVVIYPAGRDKWRTLWQLRRGRILSLPGNTIQNIETQTSPSPGGRGLGGGGQLGPIPGNFTPTPTLPPQGGGRKDGESSDYRDVANLSKRQTENGKLVFELGLALPNSFEAALGLWLAGARPRLGYNTDARGLLLNVAVSGARGLAGLHTVYYFLGVLQGLGGIDNFLPPRLHLGDGEVKAAAALLESTKGEGPWVGLSPGAAYGPAKRWPPERFAALGAELSREYGARLVLLGGPEDRGAGEQVKAKLPGALDLIGATSLRQALGVLTHLKLLITNDSGLMHAAAALGTPLIALFGSTDPVATGPFTDRATVLRHPLPCSPCLKRTCDQDYQCLLAISVAEVLDAARVWLKEDA